MLINDIYPAGVRKLNKFFIYCTYAAFEMNRTTKCQIERQKNNYKNENKDAHEIEKKKHQVFYCEKSKKNLEEKRYVSTNFFTFRCSFFFFMSIWENCIYLSYTRVKRRSLMQNTREYYFDTEMKSARMTSLQEWSAFVRTDFDKIGYRLRLHELSAHDSLFSANCLFPAKHVLLINLLSFGSGVWLLTRDDDNSWRFTSFNSVESWRSLIFLLS